MSFLSDWVAKLQEGHTITWGDSIVLQRVQMSLLNADKHHRQAREGQTMQELLEREVERQQGELTTLYARIARMERELAVVKRQRDDEVRMREELSSELCDLEQQRDTLRAGLTQAKLLKPRTATDVLFPGAA